MTFNWQAMSRDEFLSWLVPHALAKLAKGDGLDRISEATDHFTKVSITMQINGIDVPDAESFLNRLHEAYSEQVEKAAADLIAEHSQYMEAEDIVSAAFSEARQAIRQQLTALGLHIEDHRGDS